MKRRNRNLLVLFVLISLGIHLGVGALLTHWQQPEEDPAPTLAAVPVIRKPEPSKPPPKPELAKADKPPPGTQRFQPTETPEKTTGTRDQRTEKKSPDTKPSIAKKPPPEPETQLESHEPEPMTDKEHRQYRKQLLTHFEPDWTKIPDLVVMADADTQQAVSRFFGMVLIAYPKDDPKPRYAIVINPEAGKYQYTREFDFSRYSNRVKDRSNVPEYARLVGRARRRLGIPDELAIASLVPAEADAYFAAKQVEAIEAAGLSVEQASRTEGHYARNARGQYMLIIDCIITQEGERVRAQDPERSLAATS